ncbi:MAG: type II toxin-antitoxin system ParD family antitoxin [Gammaproteobacteria bacterium]
MNKHIRINLHDRFQDENPDAKQALLRSAIQEGLDSGPAELFDFDKFVSSKEK